MEVVKNKANPTKKSSEVKEVDKESTNNLIGHFPYFLSPLPRSKIKGT